MYHYEKMTKTRSRTIQLFSRIWIDKDIGGLF